MAELGRRAVAQAVAGLRVDQGNVLAVHHAIKAEADELDRLMAIHEPALHVEPLGADPVSQWATPIFNQRLDAFKAQCHCYIDALYEAAARLAGTARAYGFTEQQIADSYLAYQRDRADSSK